MALNMFICLQTRLRSFFPHQKWGKSYCQKNVCAPVKKFAILRCIWDCIQGSFFQISHVLVHFNVHVISVERKSTFTSAENEQSIRCNRIAKTIIQYTHCYWSSYRILIQVYFHHIISSFYSQNFTCISTWSPLSL